MLPLQNNERFINGDSPDCVMEVQPDQFLAVRHSALNGNDYEVGKLVEDTLKYGAFTPDRKIIPCFEGDILQIQETDEVVLTHQNVGPLTEDKYRNLREMGIATSLGEVLDKISEYTANNADQRVVLCFEPKSGTTDDTIAETVRLLAEYDIRDAYFDSFFGGRLDAVQEANEVHGTNYARSLHLWGNLGNFEAMVTKPKAGQDIITVPDPMSFGKMEGKEVIYGAVGSPERLMELARDPKVRGAYVRLKEGAGMKGALTKLGNSVTNTQKLRRTQISEFSVA